MNWDTTLEAALVIRGTLLGETDLPARDHVTRIAEVDGLLGAMAAPNGHKSNVVNHRRAHIDTSGKHQARRGNPTTSGPESPRDSPHASGQLCHRITSGPGRSEAHSETHHSRDSGIHRPRTGCAGRSRPRCSISRSRLPKLPGGHIPSHASADSGLGPFSTGASSSRRHSALHSHTQQWKIDPTAGSLESSASRGRELTTSTFVLTREPASTGPQPRSQLIQL